MTPIDFSIISTSPRRAYYKHETNDWKSQQIPYISRTHTSESRKKKYLFYKVQCQSIIILLKSTSKNYFLKFRNLPTLCTKLSQSFSTGVREKSPRRKMKSNCMIGVSSQVHGSVLIKRKVKEVMKLFHRTGKCGLPSIELY